MSEIFKPNYEMKALVLELELDKMQRKFSKFMYNQSAIDLRKTYTGLEGVNPITFTDEEISCINNVRDNNPILWRESEKVNHASYERTKRLSNRIKSMLELGSCIFLTLTFTDEVLSKTSAETRKKYVKNALKDMSDYYIANIDYGSKNEREHYHAIVRADKVSHKVWTYGAINFERIRYKNDCEVKLAKYVSKLTNHAIKDTCQNNKIIYSRQV